MPAGDPIRLSRIFHKNYLTMSAFLHCGRTAIAFIRQNGWRAAVAAPLIKALLSGRLRNKRAFRKGRKYECRIRTK
jgi:hypothetical protein